MNRISHMRGALVALFFLASSFLQASTSYTPKFGVVKSGDKKIYLSCVLQADLNESCHIYLEEKNKEPRPISREIKLVRLDNADGMMSRYIERMAKGSKEISPLAYAPVSTLTLGLVAVGGPKFLPLLVFMPLDVVGSPVGMMVDGCYRLYKLIQGVYLKKAWKALVGLRKKNSMTLSKKDCEDFLKAIKRSAI